MLAVWVRCFPRTFCFGTVEHTTYLAIGRRGFARPQVEQASPSIGDEVLRSCR